MTPNESHAGQSVPVSVSGDRLPLAGQTTNVAVIDVGSNSIRMSLAELAADGRHRLLERLHQPVRLGVDTFRRGRIGGLAMRTACAALAGFARVMADYGVQRYRAVATSAVREAANRDAFLDRVALTSGLQLECVEGIEESRLVYQTVRARLGTTAPWTTDTAMIFTLGSGSAEITVLEAGRVCYCETRRIGALRLLEILDLHGPHATRRLLSVFLDDVAASVQRLHPLADIRQLYVISSDMQRIAPFLVGPHQSASGLGQPPSARLAAADEQVVAIPRQRFETVLAELVGRAPSDPTSPLMQGLSADQQETLLPSLMAVHSFWKITTAQQAVLLNVLMTDSLLQDYAARWQRGQAGTVATPATAPTGHRHRPSQPAAMGAPAHPDTCRADDADDDFHKQVLHSAIGLGRRYHFDETHARHVRTLAVTLFDGLMSLHGQGPHERLLLELAALLHDVGLYLSPASHHKHSMYLIEHSEIMGMTGDDLRLVAVTARYHRRSLPRTQHPEFATLTRPEQMTVAKLAAVLRLAEALDRSHAQAVRELGVELPSTLSSSPPLSPSWAAPSTTKNPQLILTATADDDLSLEQWALPTKADLFESLYGHSVRLCIRPPGQRLVAP